MSASWHAKLDAVIDLGVSDMVGLRRHLHMHPEPSGEELQTSLHLYQMFAKAGLSVRMGPEGCGVVVDGRSQKHSKRIAVRADCDALRITVGCRR
jgi:amidohydrolase